MSSSLSGIIFASLAFIIWGFAPLYFAEVSEVSALEVLCHRIIWSTVFLGLYLKSSRQFSKLRLILRDKKLIKPLLVTTLLISANWLLFIYTVASGQTLEASLGYFINPVFVVALGVIFLKEKLSPIKMISLLFVIIAVSYQLISLGRLPWLALGLTATFGLYGLIRKLVSIDAITGLFVETILVVPFALGYLFYLAHTDKLMFISQGLDMKILLIFAGIITSVPLVFFTAGARRLHYSSMGFLQYLSPSLQFYVAVFIFSEPLNQDKLYSFMLIWFGLFLFASESLFRNRRAFVKSAKIT